MGSVELFILAHKVMRSQPTAASFRVIRDGRGGEGRKSLWSLDLGGLDRNYQATLVCGQLLITYRYAVEYTRNRYQKSVCTA